MDDKVLKSSMDQLNEKRTTLKKAEANLSQVISKKEEQIKSITDKLEELRARENELNSKWLSAAEFCVGKLKKNNAMLKDFDDFIGTTEKSQEKIEESVMTLLHVVNKESDILFRKKKQVAAETHKWVPVSIS